MLCPGTSWSQPTLPGAIPSLDGAAGEAEPGFGRHRATLQRNTLATHTPKTPTKQSDSSVTDLKEEEPLVM